MWVVVHHLTGPAQALGVKALALPHPAYLLLRGGYTAVQAFFVLSGLVLARGYVKTQWTGRTLAQYLRGRFARVYPVYLLSLAIVSPFIWADPHPLKRPFLAAHALLAQAWFGPDPVNWNTPAWSLSCEAFFYVAFPLAVLLVRRPSWPKVAALALAACALTPLMYAVGVSDGVKPLVHFSDFLMGITASAALALIERRATRPAGAWIYLPALAGGMAAIAWPALIPWGIGLNPVLRPLDALLILGLALGGGWIARALSSAPVVYLGKASYAVYILHVPILWWMQHRGGPVSPALYVALVIGVSSLVYSFYEEPANRWLRRR
jgi:peptidoglycan/LPS O-acetylase OafA/YrhL